MAFHVRKTEHNGAKHGPQFPNADKEYTPAQRRIIDARVAKADADIKAGRVSPVFNTAEELIAHLHKAAKKTSSRRKN
jgi:hypothetical protein